MKPALIGCRLLLLVAMPVAAMSVVAVADTEAIRVTYLVSTPDKRLVFVMLAPSGSYEFCSNIIQEVDNRPSPSQLDLDGARYWHKQCDLTLQLKQKYKASGLYSAKDSDHPLWTVSDYSYRVFLSSDGRYLVHTGPWAHSDSDEAVEFFDQGKLVRRYSVGELFWTSLLFPHTVSHFNYFKGESYDDARKEYTLTSVNADKIVFDVETGKIKSSSRPTLWKTVGYGSVPIFILIAFFLRRRASMP